MEMEKIKLYSIYTDENSILRDFFLKSIQDDWEVKISYWGNAGEGGGSGFTLGWYNILRKRIGFLLDKIKENWGKIIIWSDIDIQFFGKCSGLISKSIIDKDIIFLSEHWPKKEVNGGFYVMRCNSKTLLFLESVLQTKIEELPRGDQTAMNDILKANIIGIKWDILPRQFWAMSHGWPPPISLVLHHANCTRPQIRNGSTIGSLEQKIEQLERVRKYVTLHKEWKWLFYVPDQTFFMLRYFKNFLSAFKGKNYKQ